MKKKSFSTRGYAEIHSQRLFLDNKKDIKEKVIFKIRTVKICIENLQTHTIYFFEIH
jgi:hypothetical protein